MSFASPIGRRPVLADARRPLTVDATLVAVLAITVAGAVLRFAELGHQGLWYDESYTALLVSRSPGKMLGLIPHTESTPPLYYCLAWAWVRVFGRSPAGLTRAPRQRRPKSPPSLARIDGRTPLSLGSGAGSARGASSGP